VLLRSRPRPHPLAPLYTDLPAPPPTHTHTHARTRPQDRFPEHLGALYVINAPFIFRSIWACVKPLLDERTVKKVHVLGTEYTGTLLAMIPRGGRAGGRLVGASVCVGGGGR
jgi:hypothetical protein